jgi:hypothetical protein
MKQPELTPAEVNQRRFAPVRAGLIGGVTLAIAMTALVVSKDEGGRLLGMMIVSAGLNIVGYYSASQSASATRGKAMRAGAVGGLIAGVLIALAFAAASIIQSFQPELFNAIVKQAAPGLPQFQRDQLFTGGVLTAEGRAVFQAAMVLSISLCGMGLPVIGAIERVRI